MDKIEEERKDGEKNCIKKNTPPPRSFYSSPDIIRMSKQRRLRWAEYVAGMEEFIIAFKFVSKI